jgi:uncharacterized YigZ family protein
MIYVPRETNEATHKEKRSIFIGILHPVSTKEKAGRLLKRCRKQHPKARHICWAYRFYYNGDFYENSSDAGEPSGTAGKSILNNLLKNNIGNCILTIVRIFGGIKLGKKGLTQAYATCASLVLNNANLVNWAPESNVYVRSPMQFYGQLSSLISSEDLEIQENHSRDTIHWAIKMKDAEIGAFQKKYPK